jgi:hypothetical protein
MHEHQDASLIFPTNPEAVFREVRQVALELDPTPALDPLEAAWQDTLRLFSGRFPGYQASKTRYHDLGHTLAVVLATVRLLDGARLAGLALGADMLLLALICALFHDTGLIQKQEERGGTGARFTLGHEERSILFLKDYLEERGLLSSCRADCPHIIGCTIVSLDPAQIPFRSRESRLAGRILGSADLIAQMADRLYLEKLLYLYREFEEGGVTGFTSEFDLLRKTTSFYRNVSRQRLKNSLGNVTSYLRLHFQKRFGEEKDFYQEGIDKNISYLEDTVLKYETDYRRMLRRAGIVAELAETS